MNKCNIQKYMNSYLRDEFNIDLPFKSNGDLERQFIKLSELSIRQDRLIQILSKQKSTHEAQGLSLKWIEFQNTFWRFVFGDINSIYNEINIRDKFEYLEKKLIELYANYNNNSAIDTSDVSRVVVDVTNTLNAEFHTGIQRVVHKISTHLMSRNVYLVFLFEKKLYTYDIDHLNIVSFEFRRNDIFLMLDSCIDYRNLIAQAMLENTRAGGFNVSIVYDVIPLDYPLICGAAIPYKYYMWLKECVLNSDQIICNTNTVKCKIQTILSQLDNGKSQIPPVDFFLLGSELEEAEITNISPTLINLLENKTNIFLSVGTIEPRKAYSVALDAVEKAWQNGDDFIYIIVGRYGWFQNKVRDRIINHKEINNRLYWFEGLSDAELNYLYSRSRSLIYATIDEGFGLPLVEAAKHKLPAIVSDIEVIREIAGHEVQYFDVADSEMLAQCINQFCNTPKIEPNMSLISWETSAKSLYIKIKDLYYSKVNLS